MRTNELEFSLCFSDAFNHALGSPASLLPSLLLTGSIVFGESGLQLPLPAQSVSTGKSEKRSVSQCTHHSICLQLQPHVPPTPALSHHIMYSFISFSLLSYVLQWATES